MRLTRPLLHRISPLVSPPEVPSIFVPLRAQVAELLSAVGEAYKAIDIRCAIREWAATWNCSTPSPLPLNGPGESSHMDSLQAGR